MNEEAVIVSMVSYVSNRLRQGEPLEPMLRRWPAQPRPQGPPSVDAYDAAKRLFDEGEKD